MACSKRRIGTASSAVPTRPRLPHIISTVSKAPSVASTLSSGSRRTSRSPRRRQTSTAPVLGEERLCGERRTCPAVVQFQDELTGLA